MIEDALYHRLVAAGVAKVYPKFAPQDEPPPLVTYETISPGTVESLTGASGLAAPVIRVTAWALTWNEAKDLASQVRAALSTTTRSMWGDVLVYGVSSSEGDEPADMDPEFHAVSRDYTIWHRE